MYLISLMYFSNNEKNTAGFFMGHNLWVRLQKTKQKPFFLPVTGSKQIRVVAFMYTTFDTRFPLKKNQMLQNVFLICVTLRLHAILVNNKYVK